MLTLAIPSKHEGKHGNMVGRGKVADEMKVKDWLGYRGRMSWDIQWKMGMHVHVLELANEPLTNLDPGIADDMTKGCERMKNF